MTSLSPVRTLEVDVGPSLEKLIGRFAFFAPLALLGSVREEADFRALDAVHGLGIKGPHQGELDEFFRGVPDRSADIEDRHLAASP